MIGTAALLALSVARAWELPHRLPARQPVDTVGEVTASFNSDAALVEVYDRASGLRVLRHRLPAVRGVRVAPDGRSVFVAHGTGLARWDLPTDTVTELPFGAGEDAYDTPTVVLFQGVPAVGSLPGGDVVALFGTYYSGSYIGALTLARWSGGKPASPVTLERSGYAAAVGMQIVGDEVVVAWADGTLQSVRGDVVTERSAPLGQARAFQAPPEGSEFARGRKTEQPVTIEHLSAFQVSPDGSKIAWGGAHDQLVVTDRGGAELARSPRAPVATRGSVNDPSVTWLRWDPSGTTLSARWVDPEAGSPFGLESLDFTWDLQTGRTTDTDALSEDPLPGSAAPRRCVDWRIDGTTVTLRCHDTWAVDVRSAQLRVLERKDARWVKDELRGPGGVAVHIPPEPEATKRARLIGAEDAPDGRYFSNAFEDRAADGSESAFLLVWSAAGGEPRAKIPLPALPSETTWAQDRVLVTADSHTLLHSVPDGRLLLDVRGTLASRYRADDWAVAGSLLVGCPPRDDGEKADCAAFRLSDGTRVGSLTTTPVSLPSQTGPTRFVGRRDDDSVCLEELGRGCVTPLPTPEEYGDSWHLSPDGSSLLLEHRLADDLAHFTVYDPGTGAAIREIEAPSWVGFPAPGVVAFGGDDEMTLLRSDGATFRLTAVEVDGVPHLVGLGSNGALIGDEVSLRQVHRGAAGALEFYAGRAKKNALRVFLAGR